MNYFFTSDTHFSHKNSLLFSEQRKQFQTIDELDQRIIDNWNKTVSNKDVIYHLGDVFFCALNKAQRILDQLNGQKILILGNHDYSFFKKSSKLNNSFLGIYNYYEVKNLIRQGIVLSHYPFYSWNKKSYGSFHLHGHLHGNKGNEYPTGKIIDVGIDNNNLFPFSWDEIKLKLDKEEIKNEFN